MNKVQHINLGGLPFTIDEDAYEHLRNYLGTIHRHFQGSEGYEEITNDIEARMAELFQESLGERNTIITMKEVKDAIVIMGTPEDFGAEPLGEEPEPGSRKSSGYRPGKRLFRNPEDEVLGGVCSGIAAYFGIADPLWIRLLFIVITISGGFGIPAYLILWAIVPKAETASDRLAMRGEPINASNIGRIIEEEFQHISDKVSELGSELGGKKKEFSASGAGNAIGDALRQGISLIGQVLRALVEVVMKLWKPLLILIGGALILAFAVAWIATVGSVVFAWPLFEFFSPEMPFLSILGAFNLLIIIGMVLLALVLTITRLLYGARMTPAWRAGLTAFWVLNVISLFVVLPMFARQFAQEGEITRQLSLEAIPSDTLRLRMGESFHGDSWFQVDELKLVNDQLISNEINLYIEKADGADFELVEENKARGHSFNTAESLARAIHYEVGQEGSQLTLPSYFAIPKGEKWRAQEVKLHLKVPVGKSIFIDGNVYDYVRRINKADDEVHLYRNPDKVWTMTEEGLVCNSCAGNEEEGLSFEDFNRIRIEGGLKVNIERGDGYEVRLTGSSDEVKMEQLDGRLTVDGGQEQPSSPIRLFITLPELKQLEADATDDIRLEGFNGGTMQLSLTGSQELKADVTIDSLILVQEGESEVGLRGSYAYLKATLSGNSELNAEKAEIAEADVSASGTSEVKLGHVSKLAQQVEGESQVSVKEK
ncbi:MAG: DUF2807 domain-containing protein [Phaeodactylibacter sp.]|nr:DUF2807 domain-containing protein [Phaeodactylibacter sp.]MCB9263566.1 DUF2807 domain-containing protein [Lewinellaceae bacterium]MCB9287557.1 DUF2807 domain-containing protein [Lewinellaceae bacterium]